MANVLGTVEPSGISVLFPESVLKHFFFTCLSLKSASYYQTEELMFCKLVFYVYSFSADSNMSRSSFKTVRMCKKEIESTNKCLACERATTWVLETYFHYAVLCSDYLAQFWEKALGHRNLGKCLYHWDSMWCPFQLSLLFWFLLITFGSKCITLIASYLV